MIVIWLLPIALPLVLALALVVTGPAREAARRIAPWAAAPALVLALTPEPPERIGLTWLLLGTELGLDLVGRIFLFLTAFLWLAAGVHARSYTAADPKRHRFFVYYLLAMAGNLGMAIAQDAVSFYLLFALMTFAAYGLVVHPGHAEARRAGRIYIVMAVVGETMLLIGLLLAVSAADGALSLAAMPPAVAEAPTRDLIIGLLLGGFGIKVGAIPLHVWLPLAHPVAPTPASAVLSGSMIKAGLLGWLRFLPLGEAALPGWGGLLIVAGIGAAFFGVVIGVTQTNPKTALAYSSISQMGIINVGIGVALVEPRSLPLALGAVLAYALHHGLAKGSLFLATASAPALLAGSRWGMRLLAAVAVLLPAAALAGLPFTSGAISKLALKGAVEQLPGPWPNWLEYLLPLAAVGTTLLMVRFALLLRRPAVDGKHERADRGQWLPWLGVVIGVALAVWLVPGYYGLQVYDAGLWSVRNLWLSSWPVLVGLALALSAVVLARRTGFGLPVIAPGDLLIPLGRSVERLPEPHPERLPEPHDPVARLASRWYGLFAQDDEARRLARAERALTRWETAGLLLLAGLAASVVLLWMA
jgi:formate hydrogenlyase subunit 3/multisubunit Na+/H+ antiporter MnhD subunit